MSLINSEMSYEYLVSVVIITYNSSKYVVETLESVKRQTYKDIELIVSDDCSVDGTVKICEEWLQDNKKRFVDVKLLSTKENSGISANCNNGIVNSCGEWIKIIAGDDCLLEECIWSFVDFSKRCKCASIIFCDVVSDCSNSDSFQELAHFAQLSVREQYKMLLKVNVLPSPGLYIKKDLLISQGLFDESYPLFDDYPFYINLLKNNHKIFVINKKLVRYRTAGEGVSAGRFVNMKYCSDLLRYRVKVHLKNLIACKMYYLLPHCFVEIFVLYLAINNYIKTRFFFNYLLKSLNPILKIKKIFHFIVHA